MKKRSLSFIGVICLFMLVGCSFGSGSLKVVVSVPEQFQPELTSVHDFNSVKILVTQGQKVKEQTQNVFPTQHQFETLFTDMHVGSCKVNVLISDSEGRTVYTGTGTASIQSGKETVANITVAPASGTVTVEVDLPDEMNVQSGTVTMTHCLTQIDDPSQVTADLTINGEKATATFTDLYATIWGITVSLQDADQVEVGCGNTTVKVLPSQHINVNVPITRPVERGALGGNATLSQQGDHAGIKVTIGNYSTTTDSAGHYRIEGIPVGTYVVNATKEGYLSDSAIVEIISNETRFAEDLILYPLEAYGSVCGYAKYLDNVNNIGIAVKIQTLDGLDLIALTDETGYFTFPQVPVDPVSNKAKYILTAFALNPNLPYGTDSQEIEVVGNITTTIPGDFILRLAGIELMIFADDETPWNSNALAQMLGALDVEYQIYRSSDMATVTLPLNKIVWIINDQPQSFYDAYVADQGKFDTFVNNGGTMLFEACDKGWNEGSLSKAGGTLPGEVVSTLSYSSTNVVVNPTHPMMKGVPVDLVGNYASHNYFSNLPIGHTTLTTTPDGFPTLVEYRYGKGRVVATGQPLEFSWKANQSPKTIYPNLVYYTFNMPIPDPVVAASKEHPTPTRFSGSQR